MQAIFRGFAVLSTYPHFFFQVLVVAIPCVFKSHYPHHPSNGYNAPFEGIFVMLTVLTLNKYL